ncbi:MAG: 50S ribosomal protein L29 [Deltaproteobacteria bacterium]|nr:50S ribosomal protein L29 [Deltaproteobacteria bacterium]MBI2342660.1 50S ribosomal protein L29 [Deltaproteobacteria bacterium]MBI2975177.1 50S ribosomal protein L29 [Deltaproteobacteria bacterium]
MKKKEVDIKSKTLEELVNLSRDYKADLARLRFRHSTGQLEKTSDLGKLRKTIARVNTFIRQKELAKNAKAN